MNWEAIFGVANTAALLSWVLLIVLPRWRFVLPSLAIIVPGLLSMAYVVLVAVFFFRVEGGGFGTLAEVKTLFTSDPVVLAGWLHYLAFDLLIGIHIARRCDALGVNRLLQAPVLVSTFMFGPLGYLLFLAIEATGKFAGSRAVEA